LKGLIIAKRKSLGQRIKMLREEIGMSQHDLAVATGISNGSVSTIEGGKASFGIDQIIAVGYFFGFELTDLDAENFICPNENLLRSQIISFHKAHHSTAYEYLEKPPTINYAIRKRVLKSNLLNAPQKIKEIREFIKTEYGWTYKGSSLTNTLNALAKEGLIKIETHPKNKNWKVYHKA
jgi:transcriptional regulator with XRE-family HTH domain